MNKEEYITQFREQMLPKYIELAEDEPYLPPRLEKIYISNLRECSRCKQWLPLLQFHGNRTYCRTCEKIQTIKREKNKCNKI